MLCWSCRKEIADDAKMCKYCEAEVEPEPTDDEIATVKDMMADMGPEVIRDLQAVFNESETGEDFVRSIMVGDCPNCGSTSTRDCENDPDIDDICVSKCLDCGALWCPECGEQFAKGQTQCRHCATD